MNRHERMNALLDLLTERHRMSVEEIAEALDASAVTIRRDLNELARQNLLTRVRGGALALGGPMELPLRYKIGRNAEAKERIAVAAQDFLTQGAVVGLNGGTTTTAVALAAGSRTDLSEVVGQPGVTVVTNAVNIAAELAARSHVRLIVTGGVVRAASYELVGSMTEQALAGLDLDTAIVGVDAISPSAGILAHDDREAAILRSFIARADRVVVVADASKLQTKAMVRIGALDEIDVVITDLDAPAELVTEFEQAGIKVVLC